MLCMVFIPTGTYFQKATYWTPNCMKRFPLPHRGCRISQRRNQIRNHIKATIQCCKGSRARTICFTIRACLLTLDIKILQILHSGKLLSPPGDVYFHFLGAVSVRDGAYYSSWRWSWNWYRGLELQVPGHIILRSVWKYWFNCGIIKISEMLDCLIAEKTQRLK